MHFSTLSESFSQPTNRLYQLRDARIKAGKPVLDLISGNVNAHGLEFPPAVLKRILAQEAQNTRMYKPDPLGQMPARRAISDYYKDEKVEIPPAQILLTPGTSLSYWYAFKLLANEGDEILCPTPSYPLFDAIASMAGARLVSYPLVEEKHWSIDLQALTTKISARTKAIVIISPHNPTGAVVSENELRKICDLAKKKGLALIHDEVFSPFVFNAKKLPRPFGMCAPLMLSLNGFSKMFALPGLKVGWMALSGEEDLVQRAIRALEMVSDTFLPVNELAQAAIPKILLEGRSFLKRYCTTVRKRTTFCANLIRERSYLSSVRAGGGFFVTVRLRSEIDEEQFAIELLDKEGVLVHPGYFYDMEGSHFVMATVARPSEQRSAFRKIDRVLRALQTA